jgi:hypothetical protein
MTSHRARRFSQTNTHPRAVVAAILALAFCLGAATAHAAGIRYFGDSTDTTFYDTSWGNRSGGSWVDLAQTSHFPVDPRHPFLGGNALRLSWLSAPGGDWAVTAAAPGWSAYDTSPYDSLVVMAWGASAVAASELPMIFLEDQGNVRTPRQALSQFCAGVPADAWTRVSVPLSVFRQNPGSADLTKINKVFFGQNPAVASGVTRTLALDEIRIVSADGAPPAAPQTATRSFERHAEVRWDAAADPDAESMRIEKLVGAAWVRIGDARAEDGGYADWLGAPGAPGVYRAVALDWSLNASAPGEPDSVATAAMTDEQWLDMAEEAAFRYFWLHGHPVSGLARERYGSGNTCASGGTGMGIMAIVAAADRGFIPREEGRARVLQIAQFLAANAQKYHGAFPHWLNGTTGAALPFNGPSDYSGDLVETAYLMEGLLAARQYFDGSHADEAAIRALATQLWEGVDWDWYRPASPGNVLYWHWSPTTGFTQSMPISGWHEGMITYLLAVASPTHPIPARCYHEGWARGGAMVNGKSFYGYLLPVGPDWGGALFYAHYTFLGFDPRGRRDAYANYFLQNRHHSLINWSYCAANPGGRVGYSAEIWGLTASDDPGGYGVHAPYSNDNGTITPSAALSSMPYTYTQSLAALKAMYRTHGQKLWGPFGYRDAFNPGSNWYAGSYIAIDQGPIAVMIENARSQLLWDRFMSNPEIAPALDALGFVPDATVEVPAEPAARAALRLAAPAPNPSGGAVALAFEIPAATVVDLAVYDVAGRRVAVLAGGQYPAGRHAVRWDGADARGARLLGGVYFCRLQAGGAVAVQRFVVLD